MNLETLAARARRALASAIDADADPATLATLRANLSAARHGARVYGVAVVPAALADAFALRPVVRTSAADTLADLATARAADAFASATL